MKSPIIDATCKQFTSHNDNKIISDEEFWSYIERNKLAFEDWRYYYQRGETVDINFLYDLATVLKKLLSGNTKSE